MKPLRLEIVGLQSYVEPVVVDFEALGRYGLFGIFGPIGSGKSSLLDALTLSLYGLVDRVSGRSKKGVMNTDADRMEVRLRFSVATPHGHSEIYEVHRAYRATEESAQRIASRLVQHTEGGVSCEPPLVLADKEREVNDHVASIVGLCAEDFMRAVVLPQGRFLDVLHLKGSERRGMLQRIFRLSAYGAQLRQRLRTRQQEEREHLAALEGELQGLGPASRAVLREAADVLEQALLAREEASAEQDRARRLHDAAARSREAHAQLAEAQEELRRTEEAGIPLAEARRQLQQAQRLGPQRGLPERWAAARAAAQSATVRATEAARCSDEVDQQLKATDALLSDAQARHRVHAPSLSEERQELQALARRVVAHAGLDVQQEEATRRADAARSRRQLLDASLRDAEDALTALEPRRRSLRRTLRKHQVQPEERQQVARVLQAHRDLEQARAAHDQATEAQLAAEDALRRAREQEVEAQTSLDRVAATLAAVQDAEAEVRATFEQLVLSGPVVEVGRERLDHARRARRAEEGLASRVQESASELDDAKNARAAAATRSQEALEQHQRLEEREASHRSAHAAAAIAERLDPGAACPVCGGTDHPAPAQAPQGPAPEGVDDAAEALRVAQVEEARCASASAAASARHASVVEQHEAARAQSDEAWQAVQALFDTPVGSLDEAEEALSTAVEAVHERDRVREQLQRASAAVQETRLDHERALGPKNQATRDRERAEAEHQRAEAALDAASGAVGAAWGAWSDVAGDRVTLFDVPNLQRRIDERDALASQADRDLASADAERELLQRTIADLQQERSAAVTDVAEAIAHRDAIQARWRALHEELDRALGTSTEEHDPLAARAEAVQEAVEERRRRLEALEEPLERLANLRETQRLAQNQAATERASAEAARQASRSALAQVWEDWRSVAADLADVGDAPASPEPLAPDVEDQLAARAEEVRALAPPDQLAAWRVEVQAHDRAIERLQARVEALDRGDGEAPPTPEVLAELEAELEQATLTLRSCTEAAATARAHHQAIEARMERSRELQRRRTEVATELEQLDHLASMLRGDRFVEFVANDLLRELAATASQHLHTLSEGRYALVLDDQGGFLVQDADAGGTTRPVTSLSGGESFLSALALALALSTQIQARGAKPLEFFFLDEGFGSLDPEALDRVMSAIERLKDGHRIIGLISHVPGVRERIPMHLLVHPAGTRQQGSSVEMRIQ